ncbi:ABC transporter permease [Candidatus Sumerlaeota bacterium]|nr:ABC transporter permease [Candidatus Sumerlaeota bacterium]
MLRRIWKVRDLLIVLVRRDLIVRYQSSVLGFFWSFAKPLVLVAIFTVAFGMFIRVESPNPNVSFALHILVGILGWSFLARCVTEAHWSVLSHSNLIKKVPLPIEVFPFSTLAGGLVDFLLGMLVVFPIVLYMTSRISGLDWIMILPQILAFLAVTVLLAFLALALSLFVSAVNVFYRDMASLSEVALQAWFYATPIVYPVSLVHQAVADGRIPRWVETLYWLNPATPIMAAYRRILLYRTAPFEASDTRILAFLGVSVLTTAVLYVLAQIVFRRYARHFADEV